MKRTFAGFGLLFLAVGCSGNGMKSSAVVPLDKDTYFETKKDGATYVFHTVESMNAFHAGNPPAMTMKKYSTPKPNVAYFESSDRLTYNRLQAEYMKSHSVQY